MALSFLIGKGELFILESDLNGTAVFQPAEQYLFGERIADLH